MLFSPFPQRLPLNLGTMILLAVVGVAVSAFCVWLTVHSCGSPSTDPTGCTLALIGTSSSGCRRFRPALGRKSSCANCLREIRSRVFYRGWLVPRARIRDGLLVFPVVQASRVRHS